MRKTILQAKEAFLAGKSFVEACDCAFNIQESSGSYDKISAAITAATGRSWKPDFIRNFSDSCHTREFYLMVLDRALENE